MKHLILPAIILCLASCSDSYVETRSIEDPIPVDSTQDTGGISLDLGDTVMTEEIEEIHYSPKDWEEKELDVNI